MHKLLVGECLTGA